MTTHLVAHAPHTVRPARFVAVPPSERPALIDLPPNPYASGEQRIQRPLTQGQADAFGPLAPYVADGEISDVFVNGVDGLFIDRGRGAEHIASWRAPSEQALRDLATRIVAVGGRHLDEASPCVDVRIGDGMRVHAVVPPISTTGTLLSIRLPRPVRLGLDDLVGDGFFEEGDEEVIKRAVRERANILITGAGGSGKTTLLSVLLGLASPSERIVAIEDVSELRVTHPHFVSLEARQPNVEGAGEVTLDRLVREALRMRPDRLVLGECRGAELRELLAALNTGHDGGAGTLHANSLTDVPARLEALGALAGMSNEAVARQTVSAIGLVLHVEKRQGRRQLVDLGEFRLDERGRLAIVSLRRAVKDGGSRERRA